MELASTIKLIFNALVIFQSLFFSFYLLSQTHARRRMNAWLAGFLLTTMISALEGFIGHFPSLLKAVLTSAPWVFYLFDPVSFLYTPLLFAYLLSLTRSSLKLRPVHWIQLAPFLILTALALHKIVITPASVIRADFIFDRLYPAWLMRGIVFGFYLQFFAYMAVALGAIRAYRRTLKNLYSAVDRINLSWLKFLVLGFIFWRLLKLVEYFLWLAPAPAAAIVFYILTAVLFLGFISLMVLKGLRHPVIFLGANGDQVRPKYERTLLPEKVRDDYRERLIRFMEENKPFLNPLLNLQDLASQIKVPGHHLSQVLNSCFDQNFFDFVNTYRIKESQRLLAGEKGRERTVLDILYDTGFNSKSVFNTAFKKHTGMTPTQFKKRLVEGSRFNE